LRAWWLLSFDAGRCAEIVLMDKPFGALDAMTRAGRTRAPLRMRVHTRRVSRTHDRRCDNQPTQGPLRSHDGGWFLSLR